MEVSVNQNHVDLLPVLVEHLHEGVLNHAKVLGEAELPDVQDVLLRTIEVRSYYNSALLSIRPAAPTPSVSHWTSGLRFVSRPFMLSETLLPTAQASRFVTRSQSELTRVVRGRLISALHTCCGRSCYGHSSFAHMSSMLEPSDVWCSLLLLNMTARWCFLYCSTPSSMQCLEW